MSSRLAAMAVVRRGGTVSLRGRSPRAGVNDRLRRPAAALIGVAVLLGAIEFAAVVRHDGVAWDEALYISQVSPRLPAAFFSAPRARGITYLIAPAVWLTGSLTALRAYLAVLSSAAIVAAYWPWLALTSRRTVVPLAALAFGTLWVTGYYGAAVIPNFWVAVAGVAMAGWFVRCARSGGRAAYAGLVVSGAVAALMRPGDALWIWLPLPVAAVLVRAWRRPTLILAVVAAPALGTAQWIVEAFLRYGGPLERLRRSSAIEGGLGWRPRGVLYELHALNGPLLCRPCGAGVRQPALVLWWLAVPPLVAGGVCLAARARRPIAVATACGVVAAAPYLLVLGYAAPRFLLPAYALLALPAGECLAGLPGLVPRFRRPLAGLVCVALVAQVGTQQYLLVRAARDNEAQRRIYARGADGLRRLGMRSPCLLGGSRAVPVAFYLGCRTEQTGGILRSTTPARFVAMAHRQPTGILVRGTSPPSFAATWTRHPLSGLGRHWSVYLPPWSG
jgi:hypothetical protein